MATPSRKRLFQMVPDIKLMEDKKMRLNVLGSDSNGNCYILQTDTEALIIEAGVRMSDVKKAL